MDKSQIKKFSQYARSILIPEMEQSISIWGNATIIPGGVQIGNHSYNDSLSLKYSSAVTSLKKQIDKKGEKALAEEAAYIWFNRIVALRFMEVNKYLPTRSSLFASDDNTGIPEIVKNIDREWDNCGCDKNAIDEYIGKYDTQSIQEIYGLILVSICNKLSEHYGFMFSKIDDWTALLFPRTILNASHILRDKANGMLNIADEDWKEVEIIGWIYQYYISERKAELDSSSNKLKNSEEIAASTQLFTPEWIVKYIVHNTVGKLDNLELTHKIKTDNNFDYDVSNLSKFKVLDPASGSGHILVRTYDVLKEVYVGRGYSLEDIPALILRDNLYGFDIDKRAHQLACFAILMKAKTDDKNIEKHADVTKNIICIKENNNFEQVDEDRYPNVKGFLKIWYNASMYGSLIRVPDDIDLEKFKEEYEKFQKENGLVADSICSREDFQILLHQTELLNNLYDCVIANPPYKAGASLDLNYTKFLNNEYPHEKGDLFAAFILKCLNFTKVGGFTGMVTMQSWMFLSTYEGLRANILNNYIIDTLIQHGTHGFPEISGEVVQTCSFTLKNNINNSNNGKYLDLRENNTALLKEEQLINACKNNDFIEKTQNSFCKIPGSPLVYAASNKMIALFEKNNIENFVLFRQGMATSDNNRFLRGWYEVDITKTSFTSCNLNDAILSKKKRFAYNKGGEFRKWYGNLYYVVNRENDGEEMKEYTSKLPQGMNVRLKSRDYYFKECYSWSKISSGNISFRYYPTGFVFDVAGCCVFETGNYLKYFLGLSNSTITIKLANLLSPTMNYELEQLKKIPVIINEDYHQQINNLVDENIEISKNDRNCYETSRDFKQHPLIQNKKDTIKDSYQHWNYNCKDKFTKLKQNEEELNKIFNEIYELQDEIDPTVEDKDITIRLADRVRDTKSFLSYIIGCIMGRYSLDHEGLVYAGGQFDSSKYTTFKADDDGIIPILDRDYSDDDIVERTKEFVKNVRGESTLDDNLNWIAESLDPESNKTADQVIRDYYNKEFYDNHCQIYQKRPIYWLFVSNPPKPKDSAFKALVYMHRYSETTIQDLRRNYVQNYQQKLLEEKSRIENNNDKASQKRVAEIDKINSELTAYANKLKDFAETHQGTIDLDDGVKVNYGMFMDAGIVAKIKL